MGVPARLFLKSESSQITPLCIFPAGTPWFMFASIIARRLVGTARCNRRNQVGAFLASRPTASFMASLNLVSESISVSLSRLMFSTNCFQLAVFIFILSHVVLNSRCSKSATTFTAASGSIWVIGFSLLGEEEDISPVSISVAAVCSFARRCATVLLTFPESLSFRVSEFCPQVKSFQKEMSFAKNPIDFESKERLCSRRQVKSMIEFITLAESTGELVLALNSKC